MATRKNMKNRKRDRQEKVLAKLEAIEKPNLNERIMINDLRIKLDRVSIRRDYFKNVTIEDHLAWSLEE